MPEQVDIAVDLGVTAPPLPEIVTIRQLVESAPVVPPQIIDGILHQSCKMMGGGSEFLKACAGKSRRSGRVGR